MIPTYPGEFLRVVIGSTIHGLVVNSTDDLDLMGVLLEAPPQILGMGEPFEQHTWRTQPEGHPSGPGDVDLTVYGLRKYLRLACNGNPTVLNLLFVPPSFRHIDSALAEELRSLTPHIVSKEAGKRYFGYMTAQRERLLGIRGQKRSGYTRRLKYQSESGFDTKYAMHLCRLAVQGIELLQRGKITFPIPEPDHSMLLEIRYGRWSLDEVVEWSQILQKTLREAEESSPLPEHPDRETVNNWLTGIYLREWGKTEAPPLQEQNPEGRGAV